MILHDVPEDCGEHWIPIIEAECGKEVLEGVRWLTFETEKPEWHNRSRDEKNVIRYAQIAKSPDKSKRRKMVDRLDNILDINVKGEYAITEKLTTTVSANNILGKNYQRYLFYPTQGFNFTATLAYSF
jgi:(p)ppGpp synthase/HD superfamily hydrolase